MVYILPKLEVKCTLKASTSAVMHLSWSQDSRGLITNDKSYEVLYYNVDAGQQDKGGLNTFRDEHWHTWTLPLGWPVQGIWTNDIDGSDINSVDRSNQPHEDGYFLVARADDFSKVQLYRYPSSIAESKCLVGRGHSSHVTKVKFSPSDEYLFSAGGNDTCIFQWKITK